ncbi:leucine-rich repeat domain-containing protein [Terrisporobacter vanillatitrophus]|uniref:leucine-rich repeat domain-containing protein n=1 Tax=Terrisporobacter vanillatitrophus TaxID=3058402 RepID=UPI003EB6C9F0
MLIIDDTAFKGCSNLKSINFPKNLTYIEENAFEYCTSLISIILPEGLNYIGDSSFGRCSSFLKNVYLPKTVDMQFTDMTILAKHIYCKHTNYTNYNYFFNNLS